MSDISSSQTGRAHRFVWYELMTTDAVAAAAFYSRVVGWESKPAGPEHGGYMLFSPPGQPMGVAGLMTLPPEVCATGGRPAWVGYIWVDDVDAYAQKVKAAGGSVMREPADIPGIGRFAVVADLHGAVFNLFRHMGPDGEPAAPGTLGHFGWNELFAGDGVTAWNFYSQLFGWAKDHAMDMGPMGVYQTFTTGGTHAAGGMMTKPAEVPVSFWNYYVNVDGIDAAIARTLEGGGKVMMGPQQVPTGSWIVQCTDPQGAMFSLLSEKR